MKKLITAFVVLSLFLTACGGGDEDDKGKADELGTTKTFETSEFTLQYPDGWEIITEKDFSSEVPRGTLVAFKRGLKDNLFTPNVNVLKNELPEPVSSLDYAKGLLQNHPARLQNFQELDRETLEVQAGERSFPSLFVIFEGKEKEDAEIKQFLQISVVKEKTSYIITAAYLPKEEKALRKTLEKTLKSFVLK